MRTRLLKPEFFHDPDLTSCTPLARWFYLGLRTVADRDGRLLDEPRRLGIQLLPVDGMDKAEGLLSELRDKGLVVRSSGAIQITRWDEKCHPKEPASRISFTETKGVSGNRTRLAVKRHDRSVASASDSASASTSASTSTSEALAAPPAPVSWSGQACDDWIARFQGTVPGGPIGKALKPLVTRYGWPAVRPAWQRYLAETDAQFASPQRFATTYGQWNGTAAPAKGGKATIDHQAQYERLLKAGPK